MPKPFIHTYSRTAAKRHRCTVCSEVIEKGTKYWRRAGRSKQGFGCLYICRSCAIRFCGIDMEEKEE